MATGRDIRAGGAFVELFAKDERLQDALRRAQKRLQGFASSARAIGAGLAAGGGVIAAPMAASVKLFASAGDQLDKMSIRTGLSTEALSELGFAAEQTGANIDAIGMAIQRMNRRLGRAIGGNESGEMTKAFEALGLTVEHLAGLSPERRLYAIADAMAAIEDPTVAAGFSQAIFGMAVDQVLPLLFQGAAGMDALRQQARALGLTVSGESATAAAELTDALNVTRRVLKQVAFVVGNELAPGVTDLNQAIAPTLASVVQWTKQNGGLIRSVAVGGVALIGLGTAVIGLGLALSVTAFALGGLATGLGAIGAVAGFVASPVGILVGVVAGLTAGLLHVSAVGEAASEALRTVGHAGRAAGAFVIDALGSIREALLAGDIEAAAAVASTGFRLAWATGLAELTIAFWETMVGLQMMALDAAEGIARTLRDAFRGETLSILRSLESVAKAANAAGVLPGLSAAIQGISGGAAVAGERSDGSGSALGLSQYQNQLAQDLAEMTREARVAVEAAAGAYQDARRRAAQAAEAASDDAAKRPAFLGLADAAEALTETARRMETFGTFSGVAASRMFGGPGDQLAARTATAAERTAKATEQLARAAQRGPLAFG